MQVSKYLSPSRGTFTNESYFMTDKSTSYGLPRREVMRRAGVLGAASTTLLAGCLTEDGDDDVEGVPDEPAEDEELELVHWWTAGGEEAALNALLESFRNEYGYSGSDINNNPAPGGAGSAIDTAIQSRVSSGDPPSTFQIWPGGSLTPYTDEDLLDSINDVWTDDMEDAYLDGVKDTARNDGDFVAVPLNIHRLNNLFYNVNVVEDAGIDVDSLSDGEDLLSAMQTADSQGYIGMAHQTSSTWSTLQMWEMVFMAQNGVDAYREVLERNVGDHESAIEDSLELVVDYSDYITPNSASVTWDEANEAVIDGDAAFLHQGDWAVGEYQNASGFDYQADWDMVPFPGTGGTYAIVMDSFVMPENNPSSTMTKQWLRQCGSIDGQAAFNREKGSIPPRTDVPTDDFPEFLQDQASDFSASNEQVPSIAHGSGIDPEGKSIFEEIFSGFIESWNASQTASRIVDEI